MGFVGCLVGVPPHDRPVRRLDISKKQLLFLGARPVLRRVVMRPGNKAIGACRDRESEMRHLVFRVGSCGLSAQDAPNDRQNGGRDNTDSSTDRQSPQAPAEGWRNHT